MTQIDLSQLPAPEVVQQIDTSVIHKRMLSRYCVLMDVDAPRVGDPLYNAFSAMSEEVARARQEFQDISLDNMVAFSSGANLQHLAAARPVEKFKTETNEQFRRRVQMAPEGFSTAGPIGAYIFHALNAHEDVLDAYPLSPDGFVIDLYILSRRGNGSASDELLRIVGNHLNAQKLRPLNDHVTVKSALIRSYQIVVELELPLGPGEAETLLVAKKRLEHLAKETHKLGGKVSLSAIDAAAHVQKSTESMVSFQPVTDVVIVEPLSSVISDFSSAPFCTQIIVRQKGK